MLTKTKTALAALLIVGTASAAMAQRIDPNLTNRLAAGADSLTGAPSLTLVAEHHKALRSARVRLNQTRDPEVNSSYGCDLLGYGCNYDYYKDWTEACCL
jgi:hypothetical protein